MTAWEYGFLYHIRTNGDRKPSGPFVYVIEEADGPSLIEGPDTFLKVANFLGSKGWLIEISSVIALKQPGETIANVALQVDGADVIWDDRTFRYVMRRDMPSR